MQKIGIPLVAAAVLASGAALRASAVGAAPQFSVLYVFQGHPDGALPNGVVAAPDGSLYGTTFYGGRRSRPCGFGCGSVFKLTPPASKGGQWSETILHSFANGPGDGAYPWAPVILGSDGTLYGVASSGGLSNPACSGCGVVFALSPPKRGHAWTETILHAFTGAPHDGSNPIGALIFGPDGSLYGTTAHGGESTLCNATGYLGCGTAFELTPPAPGKLRWEERLIYSYGGPPNDGMWPSEPLVPGSNGTLFGTTQYGGSGTQLTDCQFGGFVAGCGTVFRLAPPVRRKSPWTETVLHSFMGPPEDGAAPTGLLVERHGAIEGTTAIGGSAPCIDGNSGCGIAYTLSPQSWFETIVYEFGSVTGDGAGPDDDLIPRGKGGFYGTTGGGGTGFCRIGNGCGTAYELTPHTSGWLETTVHEFDGPTDGSGPHGLIAANGVFFGVGEYGGSSAHCQISLGCGTVFMLHR